MSRSSKKRVVITGMGLMTPAGSGTQPFWKALVEMRPALTAASVFDASALHCRLVGEVDTLNTDAFPGRKSLWQISRSIALGFGAAASALQDAGLTVTPESAAEMGVVYGTTLGGLSPLLQLDRQAMREGPRATDPMLFPSAGPSAPGCQVSITLGMQAFNTTLSNGQTSGLDALQYAAQSIALGWAKMVIAGAVEEISRDIYQACCTHGLLAGSRPGDAEKSQPFDRDRSGFVLSEGSAAFLLEEAEHAQARGARIYGEYRGYGFCFQAPPGQHRHAASIAMKQALECAGLTSAQIGGVFASANGSLHGDRVEAQALSEVVPDRPVTAIKGVVGEPYSAAGCIQAAAALLALENQTIPGTAGLDCPDRYSKQLPIARKSQSQLMDAVLINTFGRAGNHASAVLTTYVA